MPDGPQKGAFTRSSRAAAALGSVGRGHYPNTAGAPEDAKMLQEHQRLFGMGSLVSPMQEAEEAEFLMGADPTMDELAWMQRPRPPGSGRDIRLPSPRRAASSLAVPFGRSR